MVSFLLSECILVHVVLSRWCSTKSGAINLPTTKVDKHLKHLRSEGCMSQVSTSIDYKMLEHIQVN